MTAPPPHSARPASKVSRKERRRLAGADKALMQQILSAHHGEMRKGALFAQHGEIDFRLRFLYQNHRASFVLSTVCAHAGRLRVTRRGALDRRFAGLFPRLPFTSGDQAFDDAFVVQTRDVGMAARVLGQSEVRGRIAALLEGGATALHVDGERVKLTGPRAALGEQPGKDAILALVEQLDVVGHAVTKVAESGAAPAPKRDLAQVVAWTLVGATFAGGAAATIAGMEVYRPLDPLGLVVPALLLLLPALVVVPVLLALLVSRRTAPHRLFGSLAILLLMGLPFSAFGAVALGNATLDDGPPQERVVPVLEVARNTGKSKGYRAVAEKWWDEGRFRTRVDQATYERLGAEGGRLAFTTHPGRFGVEWVERVEILPPDEAR